MIRPAKPTDFEHIYSLLQQLWSEKILSKNKINGIYRHLLQRKDSINLVFTIDNKVVGFSSVELREDFHIQDLTGFMSVLIVDKNVRNKGIGSKLLKQIIIRCKKAGCKKLKFTSNFKRKRTHRFYESLGFQKAHYLFWKDF